MESLSSPLPPPPPGWSHNSFMHIYAHSYIYCNIMTTLERPQAPKILRNPNCLKKSLRQNFRTQGKARNNPQLFFASKNVQMSLQLPCVTSSTFFRMHKVSPVYCINLFTKKVKQVSSQAIFRTQSARHQNRNQYKHCQNGTIFALEFANAIAIQAL